MPVRAIKPAVTSITGNGNLVWLNEWKRRHVRASIGSRATSSASNSRVISLRPRSLAMRISAAQWGAGIAPRPRQLLTVESESDRAAATWPVPPRSSMIEPLVTIAANIVRTLRTSQEFASRETTFCRPCGPIPIMVDAPEIIGPRLKALRIALGFKTQTAFAAELGIEKNTYNPWEKGSRALTFEGACLIRRKFKVPLDYLFFGEIGELSVRTYRKIKQQAA
jgi:DNA-binding XRE family transcriptional regulator